VAPKTGNTYISGTMINRITIAMANLRFSTTPSAKNLAPGRLQQRPTTGNGNIDANLALFGSSSLSRSLWLIFYPARHHRKSRIWRWNFDAIRQNCRDVIISGFGAISIFPVVGRCCTQLPTLFSTYTWS